MPKYRIARYRWHSGAEFLEFGLCKPKKALLSRQERLHAIVVIHDGCPVDNWNEVSVDVSNWGLFHAHFQLLEKRGISVIGICLKERPKQAKRTHNLFPHLAI